MRESIYIFPGLEGPGNRFVSDNILLTPNASQSQRSGPAQENNERTKGLTPLFEQIPIPPKTLLWQFYGCCPNGPWCKNGERVHFFQ